MALAAKSMFWSPLPSEEVQVSPGASGVQKSEGAEVRRRNLEGRDGAGWTDNPADDTEIIQFFYHVL